MKFTMLFTAVIEADHPDDLTTTIAKAAKDDPAAFIDGLSLVQWAPEMEAGMRVRVKSGDQTEDLGLGTYEGVVDVYAAVNPDGSLMSLSDAENEPGPEEFPADAVVHKLENNPKIKLDSGETVYGCQVWWQPYFAPKRGSIIPV